MQSVAHHLQMHAHNNVGPERDAFARSAYNRYYYACFLSLRSAFSEINPDWARTPHKSYPEILGGSIQRRLKDERRRAQKADDLRLVSLIEGALRAIPELCKIIKEANAARVTADYEPSIQVVFNQADRFSLNGVEVSRAHEWHNRVTTLIASLLDAWRQFNA